MKGSMSFAVVFRRFVGTAVAGIFALVVSAQGLCFMGSAGQSAPHACCKSGLSAKPPECCVAPAQANLGRKAVIGGVTLDASPLAVAMVAAPVSHTLPVPRLVFTAPSPPVLRI